MKKRDDVQPFHNTARVSVSSTRILTPPQQQMNASSVNSTTSQNQFQILNVLRDTGSSMTTQTQNIQYTYTSSPTISIATNVHKNNINQQSASQQQQQSQASNVNTPNLPNRAKNANTGTIASAAAQISTNPVSTNALTPPNISGQNFPRLKVEDALSYLDQVKYKFGNQPQVYNDFLDIMKEFKSQSIDTPGVIQRVSNLFKGHPELIVGFNTFLPPGYKIEVQANDQGFAYQVSVSVPSPSGNATISTQHSPPPTTKFVPGGPHNVIQPTVNLITHSGHSQNVQSLHIQPSSQGDRTIQTHHGSGINVTQNFTRERSERLPVTSSSASNNNNNNNNNNQSNSQPAQVVAHQNNQSIQPSALTETSNNIHRIQANFNNDNQPVQFNQAIVYVNKIKCRFQEQPEKYKHFLRILHKYQNEQRRKDSKGGSPLTETEVFKQVAHLFDNQEDLLREFGQFLPDASPIATNTVISKNLTQIATSEMHDKSSSLHGNQHVNIKQMGNSLTRGNLLNSLDVYQSPGNEKDFNISSYGSMNRLEKELGRNNINSNNQKYSGVNVTGAGLKRSSGIPLGNINRSHDRNEPPIKRHKTFFRDVSYPEAARHGTLQDYAFFDKVRESLRSPDVYDNFLRCLTLYNQEIVSKTELMTLITPFLSKEPELLKKFHEFLKFSSGHESISMSVAQRQDHRIQTDTAAEIDITQCKRLGTSYCALPKTSEPKKCSGRTSLCKEVLNDTWVSFPSWSEDSTFNTSRKTQYEEFIYRCEDERFELDVVIETNSATIRVLEGVQKKMSKMPADDLARFKLDDSLGGTSQTIHQRALRRIYGDKAPDIIEGLKKNPNVAVPVVLRRLKAKEEEWREAQKCFNQQWREQNEKYYLKSLDHQGINFKHADIKALRSKSLMNQIETAYEERNDGSNGEAPSGPHLILYYKDKSILDDAANLLIHHVKRQTGIQKLEKARIKNILRQFVPELFFAPRQPLSDDEKDDVFPFTIDNIKSNFFKTTNSAENHASDKKGEDETQRNNQSSEAQKVNEGAEVESVKVEAELTKTSLSDLKVATGSDLPPAFVANTKYPEEAYTLFYGNSNWYYFLRLHAILCDRLRTMYERTQILASEEEQFKTNRRESVAVALRLKVQNEFEIVDYYPAMLDMLKSLLDGNMDCVTYEDKLRDMYGIHAYIAFTLDRVVSNAVRQLQFCVTERNALDCLELYHAETRNHATGGPCATAIKRSAAEIAYQRRIESTLQEEMYFKIVIFKIDCRVTIEMLENDMESASTNNYDQGQACSKYVERFTNPNLQRSNSVVNGMEVEVKIEKSDGEMIFANRKPLYLQRNVRNFNKRMPKYVTLKYENGEEKSPKNAPSSPSAPPAKVSSSTEDITTNSASTTLTTSTSSVPPPLIIPSSTTQNFAFPDRIGQSFYSKNYFIHDQEQVKIHYHSYKTVFCSNATNKGFVLYRYNSLKKAKQSHSKVTKTMNGKFGKFLTSWLSSRTTETQTQTTQDWLCGKNQTDFVPCKTVILRNNNINSTPYTLYNRYAVEYPATEVQSVNVIPEI